MAPELFDPSSNQQQSNSEISSSLIAIVDQDFLFHQPRQLNLLPSLFPSIFTILTQTVFSTVTTFSSTLIKKSFTLVSPDAPALLCLPSGFTVC